MHEGSLDLLVRWTIHEYGILCKRQSVGVIGRKLLISSFDIVHFSVT